MKNGLKNAFMVVMGLFLVATLCVTTWSCESNTVTTRSASDSTVIPVIRGLVPEVSLTHAPDTALKTEVWDRMKSTLAIWETRDGVKDHKVFDNTVDPLLEAKSSVDRDDYTITRDQVDILPTSIDIVRAPETKDSEGHVLELDTVIVKYPDAQVERIPVKITNHTVEYDGQIFKYPGLTLIRADFVHLKNTPVNARTRGTYISDVYRTEYKMNLVAQEKDKPNATLETITLPIYAYATRKVVENDEVEKRIVEEKTREPLNETDEKISFKLITIYKSQEQTIDLESIILYRSVGKKDPYRKDVTSFDYRLASVNDLKRGTEAQNRVEGNWTVWRKTDIYSSNIENGKSAEIVVTEYPLMHERATYKIDDFEVAFDYEDFRVVETSTTVTPQTSELAGYQKALLDNQISTTYIGYPQDVNEEVYLYKPEKKVVDIQFENPSLIEYRDSTTGDIDIIRIYDDKSRDKIHDHIKAPRSVETKSSWESLQKIASQVTGESVIVNLISSEEKTNGHWKYTNQKRRLATNVALYDGTTEQNVWETVDPNMFSYTYEGKTYTFDNISFKATEAGANVVKRGESGSFTLYDYTDAINIVYGSDIQKVTAPGLIKISNTAVVGREARNKRLTLNPSSVIAAFDEITKLANGTENSVTRSKTIPRSLIRKSEWLAYASNATENTGAPTVSLVKSTEKSEDNWTWKEETRNISAVATLSSGEQINSWEAVDPNYIVYTDGDLTVDFGTLACSVNKVGSSATLKSTEGLTETYGYVNTISVRYGNSTANDTQETTAPGTIVVQKSKAVVDHEFRNGTQNVVDHFVKLTLKYVSKYNDGSETEENITKDIDRSLIEGPAWYSKEEKAGVTTGSANVVLVSSEKVVDGNWSYIKETREITTKATLNGSTQTNKITCIDPNSITYTRDGKTYTFDKINFSAAEAGQNVVLSNETSTLATYSYTDKINVTYGNNTKSGMGRGTIDVVKEVTIVDYTIEDAKRVENKDNVTTSLKWVTLYSDNTRKSTDEVKVLPREFKLKSSWASKEKNSNQSTSATTVTMTSSSNQKDGDWAYVREVRNIKTTAKLNGSSQTNEWESSDPNRIVFSRNGKMHDFGTIAFNAIENGATVTQKSDTNTETVYDYTDNISVSYGSNSFTATAPGVITVEKEVTVVDHAIENARRVDNKDNITCYLTWVDIYSNGTRKGKDETKVIPREFKYKGPWASKEKNGNQSTSAATVTLTSSTNQKDGDWSYVREVRSIKTTAKLNGSSQTNEWESSDPNKIVFSRDGKTYDFGTIAFNATETGAKVSQKNDNSTETTYDYIDNISVSYGSNTFTSTANGTITVEKEVTVVDHAIENARRVENKDNVTCYLSWVDIYSNGTRKSKDETKVIPRDFKRKSKWASKEKNSNQSTSAATVTLTSSTNQKDGDWAYVREVRSIKTTAKLNGSSQTNEWESSDPNKIVFSRDGKTYDFGTIAFNATETGANVTKKSDNSTETVYDYTDNISVSYGSNTFTSNAPGTITVEKPWNPDFDGRLTGVAVTATLDESHQTWMYAVSVHMDNGIQPILIRQGAAVPEPINKSYKTSETDKRINSAYFSKGKNTWVNVVAEDNNGNSCMSWSYTNGDVVGMLIYSTATLWGFDGGHTSGGHPTVFTDKYSAKLSENNTVLTIYNQSGKAIATYKGMR